MPPWFASELSVFGERRISKNSAANYFQLIHFGRFGFSRFIINSQVKLYQEMMLYIESSTQKIVAVADIFGLNLMRGLK
jgi:hypothetical protein